MDYQLSVDGNDLREGLKQFKMRRKVRPTKRRAILGFDGRFFSIEALDRVVVCKAEGLWPGLATVNANVIAALAVSPPAGDVVPVSCNAGRLRIGPLTVACDWQPVSHTLLELPSAPDWIETLSLKYRTRRSTLVADGYDWAIEEAEKKLAKLVTRVAKLLAPFGVKEQDVQSLIETRLAERYGASR